jgi:glycosyltransferase involved in cell wall biosynthesis
MSAALFYHPEAYSTSGPKLMGRHAAGESFLRGFLQHAKQDQFWVQVQKQEDAEGFRVAMANQGRTGTLGVVTRDNLPLLGQAQVTFHPGPGLAEHAFQRSLYNPGSWSLCGITHTTSSAGAMDSIAALLTAPVYEWDALICTSHAVKANVTQLLQLQLSYLEHRLGVTKFTLPQLPVIPLGVHVDDFQFNTSERAEARQSLQLQPHEVVVLFMGRLSFHAKAHPLAMYQALEQAARTTGQSICLLECGWFANDYIQAAFQEAAMQYAPSVRVVHIDGRLSDQKRKAWASADVFCSLSDNIQETFGIAPVEAMAAGLPSVVSDWDGYKDTIRDGVDGFRVPTTMPPAGLGGDLALRHALGIDTYDMYCGHSCSLIAVDVEATAQAFSKLFASPNLRAEMGRTAQARARDVFDWKTVIAQYEALWQDLAARRQAAEHKGWPARPDPFQVFGHYATEVLQPDHLLAAAHADSAQAIAALAQVRALAMVKFANLVIPSQTECEAMLTALCSAPKTVKEICDLFPATRQPYIYRGLAWMLKMNLMLRVR